MKVFNFLINPIPQESQISFLKKHWNTGALSHLILPFVLFFITDSEHFHSIKYISFSICITLLVIARIGQCKNWWLKINKTPQQWLQNFDRISLLQGLLIGTIGPVLFFKYHITSFQMQFYLLTITVFSLGSIISFAVRPGTYLLFICLILLPISFTNLLFNQIEGSHFISLGILIFLIFSFSQNKQVHANQINFYKKQLAIKERDQRLHDFINSIPGPVSWLDSNLHYLDLNSNFIALSNVSHNELLGKKQTKENTPEIIVTQTKQFFASKDKTYTSEIELSINSEIRNYLSVFTKYSFSNTTHLSILCLDITDLKTKERDLESQKLQLMENEKMISLGELAGSIAHEINNPLAIISGKAHIVLNKIDNNQIDLVDLRNYITHIYDTSFRIKKIITSLRILTNEGHFGSIEAHTIKDIIQPVLDITQNKIINHKIELRLEHDEPNALINCGLIEMGQVIMNLIFNSIHAIESHNENKWIRIHSKTTNNRLQIHFSDCGFGIPESIQNKLFTPFFTTKGLEKGTGIGVSLSRKLIEKQGGKLYYDPRSAHTTFIIEFPIAEKTIQKIA